MKTQVIQLDIHDDLISIRDRMAWVKTPRILLVWPKRGGVDVRPLDLTLLRRHAESLGAELGLVTRSGEIRAAAHDLRISVFSTAAHAQKKQWLERQSARPVRRFPPINLRVVRRNLPAVDLLTFVANPIRRVIVFAVGVLAVLAVILVFIPAAEIQITLPEQKQILVIAVSSAPDIRDVQISGIVPERRLMLTVEGTDTAMSTGSATLPGQVATGEVLLMNLTNKAVSIPSGTVLLTHSDPPVSFATDTAAEVAAGKGKTVKVLIRATTPGPVGNVSSGAVTLFEGSLGLQLAVTNSEPISGGTQSRVIMATEQDRDNLRKRLLADLQRQALIRFSSQVLPGDVLFPATMTQLRVLEETFAPPAGKAGEKLTLNLRLDYSMAYASYSDLHLLAERVLNASIPVGYMATSGQIDLKAVSVFSMGQDVVRWQMRAERLMRPSIDTGQVISIVQGKTVKNAERLLTEAFGIVQSPKISLRPGWWPWLPFLPIRIAVKG